jgi:hypothetical protein
MRVKVNVFYGDCKADWECLETVDARIQLNYTLPIRTVRINALYFLLPRHRRLNEESFCFFMIAKTSLQPSSEEGYEMNDRPFKKRSRSVKVYA